ADWHHGNWNNWYGHPAAWYGAGLSTGWLASPADAYAYSNPFYAAAPSVAYNSSPTDLSYNYIDYSQPIEQPPIQVQNTYDQGTYATGYDQGAYATGYDTGAPVNADAQAADSSTPVASGPPPTPSDDGAPPEAFQRFTEARTAFKAADYPKAIRE